MAHLPSSACACGCNKMPNKGNTFVNGHDGALMRTLKKAHESGRNVSIYGVSWQPDQYARRISSSFYHQFRRVTRR